MVPSQNCFPHRYTFILYERDGRFCIIYKYRFVYRYISFRYKLSYILYADLFNQIWTSITYTTEGHDPLTKWSCAWKHHSFPTMTLKINYRTINNLFFTIILIQKCSSEWASIISSTLCCSASLGKNDYFQINTFKD